jgi:FAD/FMN-containing dehydrogenase
LPAAIVYPESAPDVSAATRLATDMGLRIAAQGTGHNAAPFGDLSDSILLKMERMRSVQIDPISRVARVEAGVLSLELVEAAAAHGLATLAGSSPDVGVIGYTLGGGMSWLGREHGLAANNVVAVELVTADGSVVRADRENEPDLFWAVRGGGGNFGVVTALEVRLFPISEVYAGILWYPLEAGEEVLCTWMELAEGEIPDELTTVGRLVSLPPIPEIPEEVRGKSFAIVEVIYDGDPVSADALLQPLRALGPINDTIDRMTMPQLSHLHMDPEQPVPAVGDGVMLGQLSSGAMSELFDVAGPNTELPLLSVEIRQLGGELAHAHPENGALASIEARYAMYAVGMTPVPEAVAPTRGQVEAVKRALLPWSARQMYLNFADTARDPGTFWSEHAYRRLRRIKALVDPGELLRANHTIEPLFDSAPA